MLHVDKHLNDCCSDQTTEVSALYPVMTDAGNVDSKLVR